MNFMKLASLVFKIASFWKWGWGTVKLGAATEKNRPQKLHIILKNVHAIWNNDFKAKTFVKIDKTNGSKKETYVKNTEENENRLENSIEG